LKLAAAIATLIVLLTCPSLSGQSGRGKICVVPISNEKPTWILNGGDYNPETLSLTIDNRNPIFCPHKESLGIDDLDTSKLHLLQVISDGKRIQSLWFRFGKSEVERCVSFDSYHLNFDVPKK
jgi:hypothetical protein